jgi:prephenate dehydrogenase
MNLFECPPEEHDRIVAHVSHLPHAIAAILCNSIAGLPPEWSLCAGAGLKDTSRIAAGDPRLWTAIFRENETAFRESLDLLESNFAKMRLTLDEPDDHSLLSFLESARNYRIHLDGDDRSPESARKPL